MALTGGIIFLIGVVLALWNRDRILQDQAPQGESELLNLMDPPDELTVSTIVPEKNPVGFVLWVDGWGEFKPEAEVP